MKFNIPSTIVSGDRITWHETLDLNPIENSLSCFIRGLGGTLDLTGVLTVNGWEFNITSDQSESLASSSKYHAHFAVFGAEGRKTLGMVELTVKPNPMATDSLDVRSDDEKELEQITKAIASLSNGVAEYYIGERRVRYTDLPVLYERQRYLRSRVLRAKSKYLGNGKNVPIRFI